MSTPDVIPAELTRRLEALSLVDRLRILAAIAELVGVAERRGAGHGRVHIPKTESPPAWLSTNPRSDERRKRT